MRARLFRTVAAAVLLLPGLVVGTSTADAAPGCSRASCTGKDPDRLGCGADAITVKEFSWGPPTERFELRYSSACEALWTRSYRATYTDVGWAQVRGYSCSWANSTCTQRPVYGSSLGPGTRWTAMIGRLSGYTFRACHSHLWFDADPDQCTSAAGGRGPRPV